MRENRIDKLVMLLSTDWFSEYWSTIGLFLMAQKKILVQIGCREIVQQILSGAKEYWSTSFSKERIEKTISMFQSMLEHSDIEKSTRERMNELISGKAESSLDTRTAWLLRSITQMIVTNSLGDRSPRLDPAIREILVNAWAKQANTIDFQGLCLGSKSQWDEYIRSLTPDLRTYLPDYVSAEIIGQNKFASLWSTIKNNLTPKQRTELLGVYRSAGQSLTGQELSVSASLLE